MILARLLPKDSKKYQSIRDSIGKYSEFLDKYNITHFFGIWTMTISGYSYLLGQIDRYSYWDWSGYTNGITRLLLATILFFLLSQKGIWAINNKRLSYFDLIIHGIFGSVFFLIGAIDLSVLEINIVGIMPYTFSFTAAIIIYQFKISYDLEKDEWEIDSWNNKNSYLLISFGLMVFSTIIGFQLDDPIISTVSMVALFFPAVAYLWPDHIRHIKRLQFYPLFILAMFACVRAPWFLIILGLLFYLIRSINYLKYGIIYPSFGVAQEETLSDV